MPPKAKISKTMIIDAGLKVIQCKGQENLNVRRIATELNCSTQPVMYHYESVQDLKTDIYQAADELHTRYIMSLDENTPNPILTIGLNYIRFASEEKNLFRFLFQSGQFHNVNFTELFGADEITNVTHLLCEQNGFTEYQAKTVFTALFTCVHGTASILANNTIIYDEEYYTELLTAVYIGIIEYMKGIV